MSEENGATPELFSPLALRGVTLPNRIVISPMCTYSAEDGMAGDWHMVHLGQYALGGAGLVFTEAAAIEAPGRITHGDLGIWSAAHAGALKPVTEFLKSHGAVPGVQLAHAGRKGSMQRPWFGNGALGEADFARGDMPWEIQAPSALPVAEGFIVPMEMSIDDIRRVQRGFADAAGRAADAGFEVLEVHCAHGYLGHSFLSPLSNRRNDAYGGDRDGRMRFVLETVEQVRAVWPDDKPLFTRVSSIDGAEGGWDLDDTVVLAGELKVRGVDVLDCSSGGIGGPVTAATPREAIPLGFRLPFSERVRAEAKMPTMTHGFIIHADHAETILTGGHADLIGIAREALFNPYWPRHAAYLLGYEPDFSDWPEQYGWWLVRRESNLRKLGVRRAGDVTSGE